MARKRTPKLTAPITIDPKLAALVIGAPVRYYLDGWRVGYLEEIKGKTARIRPVAGFMAAKPRLLSVAVSDVEALKERAKQEKHK